jgi:hypothetical protein
MAVVWNLFTFAFPPKLRSVVTFDVCGSIFVPKHKEATVQDEVNQETCNCRSNKSYAVSEVLTAFLIVTLSWTLARADRQTFTDMPYDRIDSGVYKEYPWNSWPWMWICGYTTLLQNFGNCLPLNIASHPRGLESLLTNEAMDHTLHAIISRRSTYQTN